MKKFFCAALCALLLVGVSACKKEEVQLGEPAPDLTPEEETSVQAEMEGPAQPAEVMEYDDGRIVMVLETSKPDYHTKEFVDLTVTLINSGQDPVMYVKGSGTARVPSALEIDLGGLNPVYVPQIMTTDFQMEVLEPGESVSFECPYAPYIPENGEFVYGTDHDIAFFEEGEFTAAPYGEIKGVVTFSYSLATNAAPPEEGEELTQAADFTGEAQERLEGSFLITIV